MGDAAPMYGAHLRRRSSDSFDLFAKTRILGTALIREDFAPFAEWLIGSDEHRSPLVTGADQFEQHAGLGLILGDIGEVVEDEQMIFVEFGDCRFEREIAARDLELLHCPSSDNLRQMAV